MTDEALFYDPEFELFTVATPALSDPRIRCDWIEHRGEVHLVQWQFQSMPD